jgi:hypothetical protein
MRVKEKERQKEKEKFTIMVRIRPRLKEDMHSYREGDMDEILDVPYL